MNYTRRWADGTTTAEDMEGVQHCGTHVPYGGSDLAQETIKQRRIDEQTLLDPYAKKPEKKEIKGPGERNYAAVRLANGEVIVRRSNDERRRSHSEQRIRDDLARRRAVIEAEGTSGWEKRERFKGLEVEELYTERQPCGSECQPEWDRAKTTWTFPWEPEDKRPDKYNTVRDVIKERT